MNNLLGNKFENLYVFIPKLLYWKLIITKYYIEMGIIYTVQRNDVNNVSWYVWSNFIWYNNRLYFEIRENRIIGYSWVKFISRFIST